MQYLGSFVRATLQASPDAIWNIVSDVTRHAELAGSGHVEKVEILDPAGLREGALFQSQQNFDGLRYTTTSCVLAWQPPTTFAWRVGPGALPGIAQLWYFQLTPKGDGTVVENGVVSPMPLPDFLPFTLIHDSVAQSDVPGIKPTLAKLADMLGVAAHVDYYESWRANPAMAALLPSPWLYAGGASAALLGAYLLGKRVRS